MADGKPEVPAWARSRKSERPVWVVVLAVAMLLFGGQLLLGGLTILRGFSQEVVRTPEAGAGAVHEPAGAAAALADMQALRSSLAQAHPVAVRMNALSKIALGMLLLFAVAAVFSSDARARGVTLLAAWLGIGYQISDAIFLFVVVRQGMVAAAPTLLATLAASQGAGGGGATPPSVQDLLSAADLIIVGTGLPGLLFSVLLLVYFGGRRGRAFFGSQREPGHGG
jgi:hypothetical protein